LLENIFQLKYICQKPALRTNQFLEFDYILDFKLKDQMIRNPRYSSAKDSLIEELKNQKPEYEKICKKITKPELGWHQKKTQDLAKAVSMEDRLPLYWLLNQNIHSGPNAVKKYLVSGIEYKSLYLAGSTDFYFMTLEIFDEIFKLDNDYKIQQLYDKLDKI
jgi:hypothetical protein